MAERIRCDSLKFPEHCQSCHYDVEDGYPNWCGDYYERGGFIIYGCCKCCSYFEECSDEEFKKLFDKETPNA